MSIWDRGTYECHKWQPGEVVVTLHGERVWGRYALFMLFGMTLGAVVYIVLTRLVPMH